MKLEDWNTIKFFQPTEFDSPDFLGSGATNMDFEFIKILEKIRFQCNFPFKINSGYRTPEHNATLADAKPDSAHTKGLAADIAFQDHNQLYTIVKYAMQNGIQRMGISFKGNYIHLDMDMTLPQSVIWTY